VISENVHRVPIMGHFYFYDNFGKSGPNFIFISVKFRKDLWQKL